MPLNTFSQIILTKEYPCFSFAAGIVARTADLSTAEVGRKQAVRVH